jgi:hypothetical protein
VGPQQGRKVSTLQTLPECDPDEPSTDGVGQVAGFSLHAGVATQAHERDKLERPRAEKGAVTNENYFALTVPISQRAYRYRTLFSTALDQKAIHAMRTAASFSMPRGNNRFKAQIKAALGRQIGQAKRGRPLRCLQD